MQHLPFHQIAAIDADGRVLWTAGEIPLFEGRPIHAGQRLRDQLFDVPGIDIAVDAALRGQATATPVEHEGQHLRLLSAVSSSRAWVIVLQDPERGASRDRDFIDSLPAIVYEIFEPPIDGSRAVSPDLFISHQVSSMLGYEQSTWLLRPILWRDLIHPDDLEQLTMAMHASAVGDANQLRYRMRHASGEWCWISDHQQVVERYPDGSRLVTGVFSNVTAEERTSQALAAAQARFLRLFEQSHAAMALLDIRGEMIDINPALERMGGYRRAEVRGASWLSFVHPDDRDESLRAMRSIVEADQVSYHIPKRLLTASGEVIHTRVTAMQLMSPYAAHEGELIFALLEDVTEAKQAEARLARSEAAVRGVIESIDDAFGVVDPDWNILYANEAAVAMSGLGLRPDEIIGRNMWEAMDGHDYPWAPFLLEVAASRQPAERDFELENGQWVHMRASPTADGGLSVFARDVSTRHREQRELAESEERYRALVDISPFAIAVHAGGKIVFVNPAAVRMMGARDARELIGREAMSFVAPGSRAIAAERIRMMMATGEVQAPTADEHFVRLDGTEFPVEVSASPLTWEGQSAFLIVGRDVSDRVNLEAQFRQAQKMEVVGRLAGGMAHDFSNLNTAIRGYAELIGDQLPPDSEAGEAARVIVSATERASDLIRRLLTFSRHSPGAFSPTDLGEVAIRLRPLLERTIAEDIDLELDVAPELPAVLIDPSQFEHVLLNLVVNARDAMPEGGRLKISIAPFAGAPTGGERGQRYLLVTVADSGVGMGADVLEQAVTPFFTTKAPGEGTGLGLALVYGIVTAAGGILDINSMPGRGTRIHIFLPVTVGQLATPAPDRATRPAPVPATTSARLLLVEDDPHVRDVAVRALSKAGYQVDQAPDPAVAMATFGSECHAYDLLITDVIMPGSSGRDLAEQVRARCPHIRVLFMSGYTEEQLARRGVSHTGTGFLAKPFAPAALLQAVQELLAGPAPGDDDDEETATRDAD